MGCMGCYLSLDEGLKYNSVFLLIGNDGTKGSSGQPGERGATGSTGPQGNTGFTGPSGPVGDTGASGPIGDTGKSNAAFATSMYEIKDG